MSESVYKVIELVGASSESWEKAASVALAQAQKSIRDIRIAEVETLDVAVGKDGGLLYRAKLKVSFKFQTS